MQDIHLIDSSESRISEYERIQHSYEQKGIVPIIDAYQNIIHLLQEKIDELSQINYSFEQLPIISKQVVDIRRDFSFLHGLWDVLNYGLYESLRKPSNIVAWSDVLISNDILDVNCLKSFGGRYNRDTHLPKIDRKLVWPALDQLERQFKDAYYPITLAMATEISSKFKALEIPISDDYNSASPLRRLSCQYAKGFGSWLVSNGDMLVYLTGARGPLATNLTAVREESASLDVLKKIEDLVGKFSVYAEYIVNDKSYSPLGEFEGLQIAMVQRVNRSAQLGYQNEICLAGVITDQPVSNAPLSIGPLTRQAQSLVRGIDSIIKSVVASPPQQPKDFQILGADLFKLVPDALYPIRDSYIPVIG